MHVNMPVIMLEKSKVLIALRELNESPCFIKHQEIILTATKLAPPGLVGAFLRTSVMED